MKPTASRWYWVQRYYPSTLGFLGAVAMYVVAKNYPNSALKNIKELLSAALSIDAIVVGFVATAKSIIVSMDGRRPVENAKRKRSWGLVISYTSDAVNVSVVGMALSAVLLVVDLSHPTDWHRLVVAVWMGLLVATVSAYHRVALALSHLLRALDTTSVHPPPPPPRSVDDDLPLA